MFSQLYIPVCWQILGLTSPHCNPSLCCFSVYCHTQGLPHWNCGLLGCFAPASDICETRGVSNQDCMYPVNPVYQYTPGLTSPHCNPNLCCFSVYCHTQGLSHWNCGLLDALYQFQIYVRQDCMCPVNPVYPYTPGLTSPHCNPG